LIYRTGLWWKSETTVPFVRVQHSEVIQGPVERIFGLAKLKLYTAGGQTSDLSVPGLRPKKAEELKDFITKKIAIDEEE
jgi:membrane protein YdbS with pleckstrin-like domain